MWYLQGYGKAAATTIQSDSVVGSQGTETCGCQVVLFKTNTKWRRLVRQSKTVQLVVFAAELRRLAVKSLTIPFVIFLG